MPRCIARVVGAGSFRSLKYTVRVPETENLVHDTMASTPAADDYKYRMDEEEDLFEGSMEEGEGTDGDVEDEDGGKVAAVKVSCPALVWSVKELQVLCPLKDKWLVAAKEDQKEILDSAIDKLTPLQSEPPNPVTLRRALKKWFQRRIAKRKAFSPSNPPPPSAVVGWYYEAEIRASVEEKYGVKNKHEDTKFLGYWRSELSALCKDINDNPDRSSEKAQIEVWTQEWTKKGPPPELKRR